ncbi:MAG: DNA starvation/stationary phase protection protein [Erysipelotrichaceae bacterium]
MKNIQIYLSNLMVLNVKLHNLHWNVEGKQFVQLHEFTEKLYEALFEEYDAVAELLKMRSISPAARLEDYLKLTSIKEVESRKFTQDEVLDIVESDLTQMYELAKEIRNEADAEGDFVIVMSFEEQIAHYQKNLWFLKAIKG